MNETMGDLANRLKNLLDEASNVIKKLENDHECTVNIEILSIQRFAMRSSTEFQLKVTKTINIFPKEPANAVESL